METNKLTNLKKEKLLIKDLTYNTEHYHLVYGENNEYAILYNSNPLDISPFGKNQDNTLLNFITLDDAKILEETLLKKGINIHHVTKDKPKLTIYTPCAFYPPLTPDGFYKTHPGSIASFKAELYSIDDSSVLTGKYEGIERINPNITDESLLYVKDLQGFTEETFYNKYGKRKSKITPNNKRFSTDTNTSYNELDNDDSRTL